MSADAWVLVAFGVMALAVVAVAISIGRGRIDVGFESRPYLALTDDPADHRADHETDHRADPEADHRADPEAGEPPSMSENPGPRAP